MAHGGEHAISRCLYFGGTPGLGYRKLRSGRLCLNPQTAEIIPEPFTLRADDASIA